MNWGNYCFFLGRMKGIGLVTAVVLTGPDKTCWRQQEPRETTVFLLPRISSCKSALFWLLALRSHFTIPRNTHCLHVLSLTKMKSLTTKALAPCGLLSSQILAAPLFHLLLFLVAMHCNWAGYWGLAAGSPVTGTTEKVSDMRSLRVGKNHLI